MQVYPDLNDFSSKVYAKGDNLAIDLVIRSISKQSYHPINSVLLIIVISIDHTFLKETMDEDKNLLRSQKALMTETSLKLEAESSHHKDIIFVNVKEIYRNLPRKLLLAIKR